MMLSTISIRNIQFYIINLMNNYFLSQQKQNQNLQISNTHLKNNKWKSKRQLFKIASKNAYADRVHSNLDTINDQIMGDGIIPLLNPNHHCFRDREKQKEKDQTGGIRVKNFLTSKDRANLECRLLKQLILEKEQFVDAHKKVFKRQRDPLKQGPPLNFSLTPKNQNSRISEVQMRNKNAVDYSVSDTKMIYYPSWKQSKKDKWITQKGFDCMPSIIEGWKKFQKYSNGEIYIGGFQETGSKIMRQLKPDQAKPNFITTVKQNSKPFFTSDSLRSYKSQEFINKTNGKYAPIPLRKKELSSNSLHQKYSQNQNYEDIKLYKNSAKQFKSAIKRKNIQNK